MVIQQTITIGSRELRKTYSDNNKMLIQDETNIEYSEAVDPLNSPYTYVESENDIPPRKLAPEEQLELLGVAPNI